MKLKLVSCLLILLVGVPLMAAPPIGKSVRTSSALTIDNTSYLDANNIFMFVTNHGNFGRDLSDYFGNDYGTYWPFSTQADISSGANVTSPYYAGGLWVGAIDAVTGDTLVTISEYSSEYVGGPMADSTFQPDDPSFKVYKLYKDSLADNPNDDYTNWPVDQGAPMNHDTTWSVDSSADPWDSTFVSVDIVPGIIGDQTLWSVFNDANPVAHGNMLTAPLGIEVKQLAFAFSREDPLGNVVFLRYRIYNKGPKILNQCMFSIWSDPDLGGSGDDLVGTDVDLDLAFTYNATNSDQYYGTTPPSIGIDFFQGPLVYTGDMDDVAKMWGQDWPGYENMGLYSFNKYINGTDPDDAIEAYNYMLGLEDNGSVQIDPTTGLPSRFMMSGDVVAGTGWLDAAADDRRHMQTVGPLTFRPGDSTEILCAMVVGMGGDRKSSISVMKYYDRFAQTAYDIDFKLPEPPASPVVTVAELDGELVLTWTDTSEVAPGDYNFEGYTILQGETATGPWTRIANFDVVNGDAQILDEVLDPLTGALETRLVRAGTDNGISHYFVIDQDYLTGTALNNLTTYYYRVEAYAYIIDATPKIQFSANKTPISITPQKPIANEEYNEIVGDTLDVAHPAGASQGVVTVEIVDPSVLTGHDYSVTFHEFPPVIDTVFGFYEDSAAYYTYDTLTDTCEVFNQGDSLWVAVLCVDTILDSLILSNQEWDTTVTTTVDLYWRLNDVTASTIVLNEQTNQSGDDNYQVTDGFVVRVSGPPPGQMFTGFQVVANGAGPIDPPESGAAPWYGFPVPTEVDEDGYPTDGQQVGDGAWLFSTGDNGGTAGGGNRGPYDAFIARTFRGDPVRIANLGAYDWEMRFTGSNDNPGVNGGYAWAAFSSGAAIWVPFELWRIGVSTPDDPSDDVRLIPWIYDDGGDSLYYMSSYGAVLTDSTDNCGPGGCEHSISGGNNDPYTDWIYWKVPADVTPGEAGYNVFEAGMLTDPLNWPGEEAAVMDRTVLVNWNGDTTADASGGATVPSGYNQDLPEQGTVFRINTAKPNATNDVFTFSPSAPTAVAMGEEALQAIKAVPNPFYLYGPYDPAVGNRQIYFSNLPTECTITIYNLAGDYINRVEKNDASTSSAFWNVQTENNLPVASGIYIYVVDAPGFGTKIGKMAVFVEDEVLMYY
ncbi:MAG: hypothetical protein J7J98_07130 [candidate division Zixibacteria bacterium]|nr:hypothetical protein [candidate division Zixibacteria bacterium]